MWEGHCKVLVGRRGVLGRSWCQQALPSMGAWPRHQSAETGRTLLANYNTKVEPVVALTKHALYGKKPVRGEVFLTTA